MLFLTTYAQTNNDFRMRLTASTEVDFNNKLSGSMEYEHRFDQFLTTFDKAFLEPSISYDLVKDIRVGAAYRIILDQNTVRQKELEQRISAYVRYKLKFDDFELSLKSSIQYGFDELSNPSFRYNQNLISRNSFELEYNWFGTKATPFIGGEIFYHINNPNGGIFNQSRIKLGCAYKTSGNSKFQAFYMFENEFNVANPVNANIVGIAYAYKF